jgi:hypothetical protein
MFRSGPKSLKIVRSRVDQLTGTLRRTNLDKLYNNLGRYTQVLNDNRGLPKDKEVVQSDEFRTLLYCMMVNPYDYHQNGKFMNWYNFGNYPRHRMFYKVGSTQHVENCFLNEVDFIEDIQMPNASPNASADIQITKNDLVNYKDLFAPCAAMGIQNVLKPVANLLNLESTDNFDILWRVHMLDHRRYVRDMKKLNIVIDELD